MGLESGCRGRVVAPYTALRLTSRLGEPFFDSCRAVDRHEDEDRNASYARTEPLENFRM